MRQRLIALDSSRAVVLPEAWLVEQGFGEEVEIELVEGGLLLRPVTYGLSFETAADRLFAEKDELLERLSHS